MRKYALRKRPVLFCSPIMRQGGCDILKVKKSLKILLMCLNDLNAYILRVNDQVRDSKTTFDKFIFSVYNNIAVICQDICVIDEQM